MVRFVMSAAMMLTLHAGAAMAQDAAAGEKQFIVCRACHQIGPGAKNAVGPALNGILGRKAGTYSDYVYSPANKDSGIIWTPEELDTYLVAPQKVVPGTKMTFVGLKDEQKRKDVIAFLRQFGPDGKKVQ
jgi:cytochrome c